MFGGFEGAATVRVSVLTPLIAERQATAESDRAIVPMNLSNKNGTSTFGIPEIALLSVLP